LLFFLMPLPPRAPGLNWQRVLELAGGSLRSALNQTDPDLRVLVCGQDYPDLPEMQDLRVDFIEAPGPRTADGGTPAADLEQKADLLQAEAARGGATAIMIVRTGDRVSRRLARFFREQPHPVGYLITHGFVWNYEAGEIAPSEAMFREPFYKRTGTGALVAMRAESEAAEDPAAGAETAAFAELPFPGAILTVNQGVSAPAPSRMLARYHRRLRRRRITVTAGLRDEFALEGRFRPEPAPLERRALWLRDLGANLGLLRASGDGGSA